MSETQKARVHDIGIFGLAPDVFKAVLPLSEEIVRLQDALGEAEILNGIARRLLNAAILPRDGGIGPDGEFVCDAYIQLTPEESEVVLAVLSQPSNSVEP